MLPVKFSFVEEVYEIWDAFDFALDFLFALDVIFTFFTAYYDDNEILVTDHTKIAIVYLKLWFWLDLISILPLQYIFSLGDLAIFLRVSKLPKLYKIVKISKILRSAKSVRNQNTIWTSIQDILIRNPGFNRVATTLSGIFLICHIFACLWHFFARIDPGIDNWIVSNGLNDSTGFIRYLTSLYWVAQTMITVGYGDIGAINIIEQLLAICVMFVGVMFFSLTIGSLTSLISDMDTKNTVYEKKMNALISIKSTYGINEKLFNKLQLILKYDIFKADENYTHFLSSLPESMSIEVGYHIYQKIVAGIKLFEDEFKSDSLISKIGPNLKKVRFNKDEIIYNENEYPTEMYFIKSGVVSLVYTDPEDNQLIPFFPFSKGDYFGDIDIVANQNRKFTACAQTDIELLMLDEKTLKNVIFQEFRKVWIFLKKRGKVTIKHQLRLYEKAKNTYKKHKDRQQLLTSQQRILEDLDGQILPLLAEVAI